MNATLVITFIKAVVIVVAMIIGVNMWTDVIDLISKKIETNNHSIKKQRDNFKAITNKLFDHLK